MKSECFLGHWATDVQIMRLRVVQLQFLVAVANVDDEKMPKLAGKGLNNEEDVKQIVFPRYNLAGTSGKEVKHKDQLS